MKESRRAARMEKRHRRNKGASLNMVALMDIFTILVFFLLVNSSSVQPQGAAIVLPKSSAEKVPAETLIITVSSQDIILQGQRVADVSAVMAKPDLIISALRQELQYHAGKVRVLGEAPKEEKPITIMADKEVPYALLKRIMLTCTQSGYSQVSLAVTRAKKGAAS